MVGEIIWHGLGTTSTGSCSVCGLLQWKNKWPVYLQRQKGLDSKQRKQELPRKMDMAIGMKVMVTQNVVTDLDITNGARGTIVDIWLHPEEPAITELKTSIKLKHPPVCILVELDQTRTSQLTGLEEHTCVLGNIFPRIMNMQRTPSKVILCNTEHPESGYRRTRTYPLHQQRECISYSKKTYANRLHSSPSVS